MNKLLNPSLPIIPRLTFLVLLIIGMCHSVLAQELPEVVPNSFVDIYEPNNEQSYLDSYEFKSFPIFGEGGADRSVDYVYSASNLLLEINSTDNNTGLPEAQRTFQYNTNNQKTSEQLGNNKRWNWTYNSQGLIASFAQELWNSGAWLETNIEVYTYDANGNLLSMQSQQYDALNMVMIDDERHTYTYNIDQSVSTFTDERWKAQDNAWVLAFDNQYFYDSAGNLVSYQLDRILINDPAQAV